MITYYSKAMSYDCDTVPVNRGGEGAIYQTTYPELLLKIYHLNRRTRSRLAKLISMTGSKAISAVNGVEFAWPVDIIHEKNGRFAGFAMLKADSDCRLIDIISDSNRPGYNWQSRIELGRKLAIAVKTAHNAGFVIGDLNARNILVSRKNDSISMIDTDSYHIEDPATGMIYPCEVGVPELLAPEIQGKDLSGPNPLHSKQTDNFSLAVLLFSLLMNGAHPFTEKLSNTGSSSIGTLKHQDAIKNCQSVFFQAGSSGEIPLYAPPVDTLPEYVRLLFHRAFIRGHNNPHARPDADEWITALENLAKSTKACSRGKHIYYSGKKFCPWCRVETKMSKVAAINNRTTYGNCVSPQSQFNTVVNSNVTTAGRTASGKSKGRFAALSFIFSAIAVLVGSLFLRQTVTENPQALPGFTADNFGTAIVLYILGGFICWLVYILAFSHKVKDRNGRYLGAMSHFLAVTAALVGPFALLLIFSALMYAIIIGVVVMGVIMLISNS